MDPDKLAKRRARSKAHYEANKEKYKAKNKAWREANPERYKAATQKHNAKNRDKMKARSAEWYRQNKTKAAATARRNKLKRYGITPEQKAAILRRQEHQCPICERFLAESNRPAVDHSHATGAVRGVLCSRCNAALGLLEDSVANLERAIEYLSMRARADFHRWLSGLTSTTSNENSSEPSTPPA
jgi:hypothetical protein